LKKRFSSTDPAYLAAFAKIGRVVNGQYLIDDEQLANIVANDEVRQDVESEQEMEAKYNAERLKRSKAARRGWQNRFDQNYMPPQRPKSYNLGLVMKCAETAGAQNVIDACQRILETEPHPNDWKTVKEYIGE
jgi:hypothetical protein